MESDDQSLRVWEPDPGRPRQLAPIRAPAWPGASPTAQEVAAPPTFDPVRLIRELLSRWWVMAICVALGIGVAVAYIVVTPKRYLALTTVKVEQQRESVLPVDGLRKEEYRSVEELKTVEQGLMSQQLMLRVIEANGLREDPTFAAPDGGGGLGDSDMIEILSERAGASLRRGTRLIDITVVDTDPARAKRLAESFVTEAYALNAEGGLLIAESANELLNAEAARLGEQLAAAEAAVQAYREEHPDVPLDETDDVATEKMKALGAEVTKAKAERLRLEGALAKLDGSASVPVDAAALLEFPEVAKLPEIVALRQNIAAKEADFAQLQNRYGPKHPRYLAASSELAELQSALDRTAEQAGSSLQRAYDAALAAERSLEDALAEQKGMVLAKSRVEIPYAALVRERDAVKTLYEAVVKRTKETGVGGGELQGNITLFDPPVLPGNEFSPHKKVVLALGLGGGGAIGLALAFLLMLVDRNVRTVAEIESAIEIPALASIPLNGKGGLKKTLELADDPDAPSSEAFRTLRTALGFVGGGAASRSFLFTSAHEGEGKSYCASNLAATLARQGFRTLLIDGDLRRPALDGALFDRGASAGLANYLEGKEVSSEVCRETATRGLYLLAAGRSSQNPGELLASGRLEVLVADAARWFDRIVIDSPPVNAVSDAILLARHVDSVCLVVRAGQTTRQDVVQATRKLGMAGRPPVGFVLNGADPSGSVGDYGSGRSYGAAAPAGATPPILRKPGRAAREAAIEAEPLAT